jgi:hypothetical protein
MANALALCNQPVDSIPKANHITIAKPDNQGIAAVFGFSRSIQEKDVRPCGPTKWRCD